MLNCSHCSKSTYCTFENMCGACYTMLVANQKPLEKQRVELLESEPVEDVVVKLVEVTEEPKEED